MRVKLLLAGLAGLAGLAAAVAVQADESTIRRTLSAKLPAARIEHVVKTPYPGLYEVYFDNQIAYTDKDGSFMIVGYLVDVSSGQNMTHLRMRKLSAIPFSSLPFNLAIKSVKGNGKRQLVIFSDPLCLHCRKLEPELASLTDVTLYTFLYPVEQLNRGATSRARQIWCAANPARAWEDFMLRNVTPPEAPASCNDPIAKIAEIGARHSFIATPTLVFADGAVVQRQLAAAQIERLMNEVK